MSGRERSDDRLVLDPVEQIGDKDLARLMGDIEALVVEHARVHPVPVEAFTAVLLSLNSRYKGRATIHLTGIDADHRR